MICLSSSDVLQLALADSHNTNALKYTVTYAIKSNATVASSRGSSNGTSPVSIVTTPSLGDFHLVKQITVYNADLITHIVTIKMNDGNDYILCKLAVPVGATLFYSPENGFQILTNIKQMLSYDQITSNVSITSDNPASPTTIITGTSFSVDSNTTVDITFFCPSLQINSTIAGRYTYLYLFDGDTNLAVFGFCRPSSVDYAPTDIPITLCRRATATSGSHTYKIKAVSNASVSATIVSGAGTGGSDVYVPAFLKVERAN